MKKTFIVSSCIIVVVGLLIGSIAFAEMPGPDPDAFWKYITETSPYTKWSFWSDHQGMQPGRA
ncbi:MAG: hypothetical protein JRJ41_09710, partial [Deltaproteobacteria bacterium]|nr:hypothetical protein [Deltaproteobacteria bacterium]